MYESTRTDFKPAEGVLPNTLERFNLEEVKVKNKTFSDNDIINVAMILMVVMGLVAINMAVNSHSEKAEEQKDLAQQTQAVNLAVSTLDRADVVESSKMIDRAYSVATEGQTQGSYQPQMSKAEKILKKKTPTIEVFDPDSAK